MKKIYLLLSFLFISTLTIAQGIAIQGIARDNTNSAITDTNLTFTFNITKSDNTVLYSETQAIKTDNFGIFSHIVSTGNPVTGTFNVVDFSLANLKMKISVNYNANEIEVYNQAFQYTPYAHFSKKAAYATNALNAVNGVPTGSIMPYVGTDAPEGWVLCNGQSLTAITGAAALIEIVGDNVPNLNGIFLKGTGVGRYSSTTVPISLRNFQGNVIATHTSSGYTTTTGAHDHIYNDNERRNIDEEDDDYRANSFVGVNAPIAKWTDGSGAHNHNVSTTYNGGIETRPNSYGVNYIIKL
jgi:microcystin-dependent protein